MICTSDGNTISVFVRLASGEAAWGPTDVSSSETIWSLKLKVAESLDTSEKLLQLIHGELSPDLGSAIGSLCTAATDGVPNIELMVIVSSWHQEVSRVLAELLALPGEKLEIRDDPHSPTDAQIPLLLDEIARTCGSLPEEVVVWLKLLIASGKILSPPDMGGCFGFGWTSFGAGHPYYNKGNQPGLLYFGTFREEDTIIVLWVDLFGQFAEILGFPAATGKGFVWWTDTDSDLFAELLEVYSTVGGVRSMPSLELWQSWLEGGRILEPDENHGCPLYPECVASSLTDFFQRLATSGRIPRWVPQVPELDYDDKAVLDGLPKFQEKADAMCKDSGIVGTRARFSVTFDLLDSDKDGALSSHEMQAFAELTGLLPTLAFGLTDAVIASQWSTAFGEICKPCGDVSKGLDLNAFVAYCEALDVDFKYVNDSLRAGAEPPSGGHWISKEDQPIWEAMRRVDTLIATPTTAEDFLCFQSATVAGNQICFAPCDATTLLAYNVATREIEGIDIATLATGSQKFHSALHVQGKVIMVPNYANKLLVCDLETNDVRGVDILHKFILGINGPAKHNMSKNDFTGGCSKIAACCVAGEKLVMIPHSTVMEERLLIWDIEAERFIKDINITEAVSGCAQQGRLFKNDIFIFPAGDGVVVVPTEADWVLICDLTTHAVDAIDISAVENPAPPAYSTRYVKACVAAGKVVGVPLSAANLLICDLATKKARGVDVSTISTGDDRFGDAVAVGDKVIAVPGEGDSILVFEAMEEKLRGVDVSAIATGESKFSYRCCAADGKVFAGPGSSGIMLVFDIETEVAKGVDASSVLQVNGTQGECVFNTLCATGSTVVMAHDWGHLLLVYDIVSELFSVVDTLMWLPSTHWLALQAPETDE